MISRAQGCLLGQLAGDSLGSLVEFSTPGDIIRRYPEGVRDFKDGGFHNTIAGQPTDDSEMALILARSLVSAGQYNPDAVREAYVFWLNSRPFDVGVTISSALRGVVKPESQANGALMRISPLGIFGAGHGAEQVAEWARADAAITHVHPVCKEANALFAMAIAHAVRTGCDSSALYQQIVAWSQVLPIPRSLVEVVMKAAQAPPADFITYEGWVFIALQNALWQLLHAPSLEEGIVDTISRGGDTDTNAAICGALLGAVAGRNAVPERWVEVLLSCRPSASNPNVVHPRPECFWPVDALTLAEALLG